MKTTTAFIDQPTSLPLVAFFRYPSILSTILGEPVREEDQRACLEYARWIVLRQTGPTVRCEYDQPTVCAFRSPEEVDPNG